MKAISISVNDTNGILINAFCMSLCNNINHQLNENEKNLNDIIKETRSRLSIKNINLHDENYIPSRCKIVFTSFTHQLVKFLEVHKNGRKNDFWKTVIKLINDVYIVDGII